VNVFLPDMVFEPVSYCGMNMNTCSLPLLGSLRVSLRSLRSKGVSFRTSLTTIGFEGLGSLTDKSPKSLMRMLGPTGNPQARNLFDEMIIGRKAFQCLNFYRNLPGGQVSAIRGKRGSSDISQVL
jgi:hypothetical protein